VILTDVLTIYCDIISLRGKVWSRKTSLTRPLLDGVPVPSQEG